MIDRPLPPPSRNAALAVLDTNVMLDLWLFDDPRAQALRNALLQGQLVALATAAMLAELIDVLQRPFVASWPTPAAQVLDTVHTLCRQVTPPSSTIGPAPRCSDGDDQKFIDLAWAWPTQWLVSRDRAVLRLARAARAGGLRIVTPEGWAAAAA